VRGKLTRAAARNQRKPANYAHLVEYGHVAVAPVKGSSLRVPKKPRAGWTAAKAAGWVPAKPFIRPAVVTTTQQQADGFYRGIERGWNKAVNKEVSSGRHVRS
jgi:hypothetical protein